MTDERLRVESPFPEYALPRVWTWIQDFRWRVSDDFAPDSLEAFVAEWQARREKQRTWAVYRGPEIGGLVTFEPWSPVAGTSHCLFKRSFWGHRTTIPALQAVYAEIFAGGCEKILSLAFKDNANILGLARAIGGQKEGVLRKQTRRRGELVDMIAIGLLKEDFERGIVNGRRGSDGRAGEHKEGEDGNGKPADERVSVLQQ